MCMMMWYASTRFVLFFLQIAVKVLNLQKMFCYPEKDHAVLFIIEFIFRTIFLAMFIIINCFLSNVKRLRLYSTVGYFYVNHNDAKFLLYEATV